MLDAFRYLLCSKLCQHNRLVPTKDAESLALFYKVIVYKIDHIRTLLQKDSKSYTDSQDKDKLKVGMNQKSVQ